MFEEIINGFGQLTHAMKDTAANTPVGDVAKEAFDEIEPRGRGGDEVGVEVGMTDKPFLDALMFVR